jgi:ABC-type multidrug transport system ATPase subunit
MPVALRRWRGGGSAVERDEVFGALGPNGAGKSTTVGMLTTTVAPTSGHARLWGLSRTDTKRHIEDVIGAFAPGGLNDRPVDTYSTRHRRRLEVARALPVGTRSALPGRKVPHG